MVRTTAVAMSKINAWTQKADSISTPARARRIIAEVAKKVLKEYYRKACVNITLKRKLDAAALIFQCWIRIIKSKKILLVLRCNHLNSLVRKVQTRIRMYLAKGKVQSLRWERELILKRRSAVKIQLRFRVHLERRKLEKFLKVQQQFIFKNRETSAILIQSLNRGFVVRIQREKQVSAVLKIQTRVRMHVAVRTVKYIKLRIWASILLFFEIMRWRKRRKKQQNKAAKIIQNLICLWSRKRFFACCKLQRCVKEYQARMNRIRMRVKRKEKRHTITIVEPFIPKIDFMNTRSLSAPHMRDKYISVVLAPIPDDWIIVTLDFNRMAILIQTRVKLWVFNRNVAATIIQTRIRLWFIRRDISVKIIQKCALNYIHKCQQKVYAQKCSQAAEIIQRSYRRYYVRQLDTAVLPIQRVRRRSILLLSWKATVFAVLRRAHLSAEIIQCLVRTTHAIKRATNRRGIICEELSRQIEDSLQKSFDNQCWDSSNFKGSSKLDDMICPEDYDDLIHEFRWDYDRKRSLIHHGKSQVNLDDGNHNQEQKNSENYNGDSYNKSICNTNKDENTKKNSGISFDNTDTDKVSQMRQTDWAAGLFEILGIGGSDSPMPPGCLLPQRSRPLF
jgi:hypothetical protein